MHSTRFTRTFRSGIDLAPPVTPAVAPSCSFGCIAKPVPFVSSLRLSASKRSEDTHTEFQTPGTGESAQASSSAPAWGAALASKARKANAAAGLRSQRSQHQGKTLETVEAVAVTPHGSAFGSKGSAAGSDGPVVVVQPQEPYLRPQPPPPSSSSSSSSPWTSRSSTTSGSRAAPAGEGSAAPPPLTFVRPPGRPMGRSTAAGSAIPSSARKTQAGARGAGPGNGSSTSGSGSGNSVSYDPFTKARVPTRAGTAPPPAVPPPWLATAAAAKRASAAAAAGGGGGMSPPPRFSAAPPPRSRSTAMPDAKSTPRSAANAAAAAAAAAAVAAAAKPQAVAPGSTGDGDPPLSVSFSQVMGRQKRSKGDGQTDQDLDPAESNVVDYTWEPDPDLDVIEADAAAAAEEERRRRELQRDVARERRELREAAEAAVQRSYAPGAPPPPPFVGSVKAERIPGRGFGLVADEDVAAGQLLLVAVPAVCSRGPGGGLPKMRPLLSEALRLLRLADGIPSSSSSSSSSSSAAAAAADGAALASLFWGAPRPSSSRPPADLAAWRVRQSELLSTPAAAAKATATAAGKSGMTWTQQRVMSLLQLNLVAEETQDGAAAVANSEPLTSRMGVWPEVALINHSCGPNAVAVMLYDRLVVRATRRIPRGREVLLNWLGSQGALAPARERRAQLSQMYDFACRCARCRLEGSEAVSLPFLYSDAERGSEEALEAMEHALRVRDLKLLTLALQPLQEAVAQLTSAVQLLGEQVDLTGGREGLLMAAADGEDDGEEEEEYGNAGGALAAAAAAAAQQVKAVPARKTPAGASAGRAGKGRGGTAGDELGPLDRETAVSWLLGGMLPLHAACVEALAYRAAWLGMDIGPGWHWPQEQPIAVPASTAALRGSATATTAPQQLREGEGGVAVIAVEDGELEEQQAEAMAELIGSLASYVDVIAQLLPGSEIHTQAAARLLTLSRRYLGPMDRVAGEISTAVYDAHVLRYGKLDEDTFERLLAAGMEAMAAARRREAELRPEPVGGGDGGEYDGVVEGETEDLEELFLEDQRLREEAHAAAAAAAAAVQPPRSSWPLGRGDDGQAPRRVTRAATPVVRQQQQQQLEEEEDEEEEELPDGVTVARGPIAHGGSPPGARGGGGGGGGGGSRRRAVLAEAEQDLLKVLDSSRSRRSVPSVPSGASAPPRMRRPASVAPREAAAEEEDADRGGDDVAAATVRRLLRRDEAPRAGLSAEGYDNGAAAAADVNEEEEEEEEEAGGGGGGGKAGKLSPQQKFESSLDRLLQVFPGLSPSTTTSNHDVDDDEGDDDDDDDDNTSATGAAAAARTIRRPRR